jgi:hypothetical protein
VPQSRPARKEPQVVRTAQASASSANPAAQKVAQTESSDDLPLSRDELFGVKEKPRNTKDSAKPAGTEPADDLPLSRGELFGTTKDGVTNQKDATAKEKSTPKRMPVRGFSEFDPAYDYRSPAHWSRAVIRTQVEALGELSPNLKWKASARVDADPVYAWGHFYNDQVKEDQRLDLLIRETYLDTSVADWDLRLGRQHVVWGEVVGLFFADVVSAKDLRDFILPDFDIIRIPQWAARGEYFKGDSHLELIWIPVPSYNDIGKPGSEFYPFPTIVTPGFQQQFLGEEKPSNGLSDSNYGVRASTLAKGWDIGAFFYKSVSAAPTFYRQVVTTPSPTLQFTPRHDRIWQAGGTITKDFRSVVLRAETVYTANKNYEVTRISQPDGVVKQNTLDYILSLDFVPFRDSRLNVQGFQRIYFDHDPDIIYDRIESGVSLLFSTKVTPKWEPEFLIIQSLNRNDRMMRPRVHWYPQANWRMTFGVDIFVGPPLGDFGRFTDRDRVYAEARYSF